MSAVPFARRCLQLLCCMCCAAFVAARASLAADPSVGGSELPHARALRYAASAAAAALAAQLLLDWSDPAEGAQREAADGGADEALTWREDRGVSKLAPVHPPVPAAAAAAPLKHFTMAEVAKHGTADDCWIVLHGRAYDISRFVKRHPGGVGPVVNMAGKDATDVFDNYHAARIYKTMLPQYLVGEVTDVPVYAHVADFRAARQELLRRGLFETDYRFYAKHAAWLATLFLGAIALSIGALGGGGGGARMLGAAVMGVFWQQLAGIGHDLGHSGISHDFHTDHWVGSMLSALMGLSVGWWKSDHNTHHVVCNAVEHDPNIQHMPMLAVTPKIFSNAGTAEQPGTFWDTYHKKFVGMDFAAKLMVSYQHIVFYPLMALGRWNLYVQGLIFLLSKQDTLHYRGTELAGSAAYFGWVFGLAFSMPSWGLAVGWVMVSHAVAGVLHVQIVLSHWSMETYMGSPYTSKETEWYLMQMRTTMNVQTHPLLDWVHIGLQFQIEHHLFPRLPRHNLRKAKELVEPICKKHGIQYHSPGFFAGNVEMYSALKRAALAARKAEPVGGGVYQFKQSKLWEGMNLAG